VSVPVTDIVDFEIYDRMDPWRIFMSAISFPPNWPYGVVITADGSSDRPLPAIMLWGANSVAMAESAIRKAVATAKGEA
jgi:hypothetical protein